MPSLVLSARQIDMTPPTQLKESPSPDLVISLWVKFGTHQYDSAGKSQKYSLKNRRLAGQTFSFCRLRSRIPQARCRHQVDEIRWSTILASLSESWIVATVFGELSMGAPRKRIAAMSDAAISKAPFCRSSALNCDSDIASHSSQFAFSSLSKKGANLHRLELSCWHTPALTVHPSQGGLRRKRLSIFIS